MKKFLVFSVCIFFLTFPNSFSHAETLSLTTYYPAPYGIYNQLRLVPGPDPASCNNLDGLMWINSSTFELMMCQNGNVAPAPSVWSQDNGSPVVAWITDTGAYAGIGFDASATTPLRKLHVQDGAAQVVAIESTAGGSVEVELLESGAPRAYWGASGTNALVVEDSGGTQQFVIEQDGDTAIGTAAPTAGFKLDVVGVTRSEGITLYDSATATDNQLLVGYNDTNDYGFISPWDNTNSTWENLCINCGGGNVSIGSAPLAGTRFFVVGPPDPDYSTPDPDIVFQTALGDTMVYDSFGDLHINNGDVSADAFWYNSDITLKKNIEPVSGIEAIMEVEGIQFNWKKSGEADIGVSAQNIEQVFPELVSTDPHTKTKSVKYGNLIAPLIEAIKDQQREIETLKKEIEELRKHQF